NTNNTNETNNDESLNDESNENNENISDNEEIDENEETDENQAAEADGEGTLADEVEVVDVENVLLDQEEVKSRFKEDEDVFIEHNDLLYVEHDFITNLLDYELTYDEENTVAEVFEGKGDFSYKPTHEDEGIALMDVGQVYDENADEYEDIPEESADLYKFIEYEGKLYVPERIIGQFLNEPIHYERRDKTIEVGLRAEATDLYDFGIDDEYSSTSVEVTQDSSDVTIEGENYGQGIVLKDVNSSNKFAAILNKYQYSEISGFVHNKSDEETVEVKFQYNKDKTIETVDLELGETYEFENDLKGEVVFFVLAKGPAGSSSKVVVVGELK